MDAAEQTALRSGPMVDHFEVVRLVGRGGMGEVCLARNTKLGRKVAPSSASAGKNEDSFTSAQELESPVPLTTPTAGR